MVILLRVRGESRGEYLYSTRTNDEFVPGHGVVLATISKTGKDVHVSTYTPSPIMGRGLYRDILIAALGSIANHADPAIIAKRIVRAAARLLEDDEMVINRIARAILDDEAFEVDSYKTSPIDTVMSGQHVKSAEDPDSPSGRVDGTLSERAERMSQRVSREVPRRIDQLLGRKATDGELDIYLDVMAEINIIEAAA